jgi:hypothetical protein
MSTIAAPPPRHQLKSNGVFGLYRSRGIQVKEQPNCLLFVNSLNVVLERGRTTAKEQLYFPIFF